MKILPETPSVDFLRQEAKDLLVAMRESEPDATLSRAQRALAERYGFRSWDELKSEVERRRATGSTVAPELGAALASEFGLGRPAGPMTHLAWSQIGESWALDTDSGRFRIRTVLEIVTAEAAEISKRLRDAAITIGIKAPAAVRSTRGDLIAEIEGKRWCVDGWIDVGPVPNLPVTSTIATSVGARLAALHELGLPPVGHITPWLTARRSAEQWKTIVDAAKQAGATWAPLLEDAMTDILDITAICADEPRDAPMLCINDYGPGSVRLAKGDDVAIIHWDFAGTNTRTWEIGGMLNGWSLGHDGSVNEVAVRALIAGYRQNATVTPELELSIFTPAICGHLNWLSGRISRALARDDEELRRREELELRDLLSHPRRRSDFERIIAVASE